MRVNWNNLTKEDRAEYMRLQMSPAYGEGSSYYPEDVSDCGACGQPTMGSGWCLRCLKRYNELFGRLATATIKEIKGE